MKAGLVTISAVVTMPFLVAVFSSSVGGEGLKTASVILLPGAVPVTSILRGGPGAGVIFLAALFVANPLIYVGGWRRRLAHTREHLSFREAS